MPVDPLLIRAGNYHAEAGYVAARALLGSPEPPTAIFAGSDMQALGVYEEARERELRIPEDLSVVGFDDVSVSRYMSPELTTVRQPLAEMAAEAVRLALRDGERDGAPVRLEMATSLVVRSSTAPPAR